MERIKMLCSDCKYSKRVENTSVCSVFGMRTVDALHRCSVFIPKQEKEKEDEKEKC